MNWLIAVGILLAVAFVIMASIAFCRGWFHLASVSQDDKIQFVLTRKKVEGEQSKPTGSNPITRDEPNGKNEPRRF